MSISIFLKNYQHRQRPFDDMLYQWHSLVILKSPNYFYGKITYILNKSLSKLKISPYKYWG
ncbi:hypothetical protein [Moraxella lacunata]|uniref:hypothetical protein n=1 Tax=Moraxella lacunata TaxID=477 RepID=UPI003EE03F45